MSYVLSESAAGYALLKASDRKFYKSKSLIEDLDTLEKFSNKFRVCKFEKFESAAQALEEANSLIKGKVLDCLSKFLSDPILDKKSKIFVFDSKLGNAINKLDIVSKAVYDAASFDTHRSIKEFLPSLLENLNSNILDQMSLGLAHSIGRHKLSFSVDKVDTMLIQAINLLDDLDKELNLYYMRCKEWYGWHFPELSKIVTNSVVYAKVILSMGYRSNGSETDFSEILPEDIEEKVKSAAEISMGIDITDSDLENIKILATQIVDFYTDREQLLNYITSRMIVIAPNLKALIGDVLGARLISHAGSLMSLAKAPASTIQILGAEKALFKALKTKHDTPKYGIIYHASLIGQASAKNKGKIARVLAAKAAVSLRYDCLSEDRDNSGSFGLKFKQMIESRLKSLENSNSNSNFKNVIKNINKGEIVNFKSYNDDADTFNSNEKTDVLTLQENISIKKEKNDTEKKKDKSNLTKLKKRRNEESDSEKKNSKHEKRHKSKNKKD